ncbi:MAG TPA: protein phosphatase 2C domain-containing protein [Bryobacteraceae bacterium]|nr:protein phosphatase 2C domain-containing protein [Bryobacteraceae bacterium]
MASPDRTQMFRHSTACRVTVGYSTDIGCRRDTNEDCVQLTEPSDPAVITAKGLLLIVADGMGGSEAGEVASRIAAHVISVSYYASTAKPAEALKIAFQEANSEIRRFAFDRPDWRGMGTTATAVAIVNGLAFCAHVGDSRLYLVRAGRIYRMTEDHSAVNEMVKRGAISQDEARRHADRNVILRALGGGDNIETALWNEPMSVGTGDRIVACTDGLHDVVADDEIRRAAEDGGPPWACEQLVALARQRGGPDNITVAIAAMEAA